MPADRQHTTEPRVSQTATGFFTRIAKAGREVFQNSVRVCLDLFKIMIPVILLLKFLNEFQLIGHLAAPLTPFMGLVGLPPEAGLIWATSMLSSVYAGILVYASIPLAAPLSVAQVTVLSGMILVAHGLILECSITSRCGAKFWHQLAFRVVMGYVFGLTLHWVAQGFGLGGETARTLFTPAPPAPTLLAWALGELRNLGGIFGIIVCLMAAMRVLGALGITELMNRLLGPVLRHLGIGREASTVTVVGLCVGITYGSGLIIHEARSGRVGPRDVLFSVSFMGLAHALFEDTMLMALLGASLYGTFWGRLIFALVVLAVLSRLIGGGAWKGWVTPLPEPAAAAAPKTKACC